MQRVIVSALSIVSLIIAIHVSCAVASDDTEFKKGSIRYFRPAKYNEVIDLVQDAAKFSCDVIGELIVAKGFDYKLRCDLFMEQVDDLATMCDTMVGEIKLTQKRMVENAIDGGYDRDLVVYMKRIVKKIMESRRTSEREVQHELQKDMSQWILDVSVHELGKPRKSSKIGAGSQMSRMTPAQRKSLRDLGVQMPDEDDIVSDSPGNYNKLSVSAAKEDREWAVEISRKLRAEKKFRGQRKAPLDSELMARDQAERSGGVPPRASGDL
ncbi:membrane-associated protein, putative [Bodo saltans]|uniref:Membrane-associated protein, putative n=1 Tax=Bodo saltans TaxID=75058 RepID=A0A0S4J7Z0_BODSA|nr:membrane-associated protein, putative [Bodo saltans]|eukprot:CUG87548.1 membrane-associated protein, putative [Bodo saltans]